MRVRVDATTVGRVVALAIVAVMIVYFVTSDALRWDNAFLVPDLLLTVFLLVAAVLPSRLAGPALVFATTWAAAVYAVSLSTYAVRGEFADGAIHLALIMPLLIVALWISMGLVRRLPAMRSTASRP